MERQRVKRRAGLEVSMWVSVLVRGPRGENRADDGLRAMDWTDAQGAQQEQQRDWERKRRRDLRRRHTFYSPRKRARAPPPSGQLALRAGRTSSQ